MSKELLLEINEDHFRESFLKYTRKAFQMLPKLDKPRILDIGCGSGVPTIELAKLSDGEIIGIDIDQPQLNELNRKIEEEGFSNRVKAMNCSILKMNFPDRSFDLIWAEGALVNVGFQKGLKECYRVLRSNGFLVIHDDAGSIKTKLKKISSSGYKLLNSFSLPEDVWWTEYYQPLEKRIEELRMKYKNDPDANKIFERYEKEINMVKANPKAFSSAIFILQKWEKKGKEKE